MDKSVQQNFTLKNYLRMLNQIKVAHQSSSVSIHSPICQNHSFKPGQLDEVSGEGFQNSLDLYIDGQFASFFQLSIKFNHTNSHFFSISSSQTLC